MSSLQQTLIGLDQWFETMRQPAGYGGPVAHWWQSCLLYAGPMADWRYEGLICGYLNLAAQAQHDHWLKRAMQAGNDLLAAQLPNGQFWNSGFEVGPLEGGTPHEAAVVIGLLELARFLRARHDPRWQTFFQAGERNLQLYQIGCLWNGVGFQDQADHAVLVPNKHATLLEALLLYQELSGICMAKYITAAVRVMTQAQVTAAGPRQGATVHLGTGDYRLTIGIYTARCAAALVRLHETEPHPEAIAAARRMLEFLLRLIEPHGSPFGFYANQRLIRCPTWISAAGDLLRACLVLQPHANVPARAIAQLSELLCAAQTASGGLPTARGLGVRGSCRQPPRVPDFRDVLPVVGWCDKAWRALTLLATHDPFEPAPAPLGPTEQLCLWQGQACTFRETPSALQLYRADRLIYDWNKQACYPHVYQL